MPTCPECNGRGRIEKYRNRPGLLGKLRNPERFSEECTRCNGSGLIGSGKREEAVDATAISNYDDAPLLASGSGDETVRLWSLPDGMLLRTLQGHRKWIDCVAFAPDGKTLASASGDGDIKLWRVSDGELVHTLGRHEGNVSAVSFAPDGHTLASVGSDFSVKLWSVSDARLVFAITDHLYANSFAFSPAGDLIATGSNDSSIKLWNVSDGAFVASPRGAIEDASYRVWRLSFSPDGNTFAALMGYPDIELVKFRTNDGSKLQTLKCDSSGQWLTFSDDATAIIVSGDYGVNEYTRSGSVLSLMRESDQIMRSALSPSKKVIALTTFSRQKTIEVKVLRGGGLVATLEGHAQPVDAIALSPHLST
jgi:WD40 repeat protein